MNEFACEVRAGLMKPRKELPSKYLYDDLGSALFDAITVLPEYGLTRADQRILERCAPELPREFASVAEFGSGSGRKTRVVLQSLEPDAYFPIDVSRHALERCRRELADVIEITAMEGSYLNGLAQIPRADGPMLVLFLGSTIGNFDSRCRNDFLRQVRVGLREGDALLIGCDLEKPIEILLDAYDDPTGVTASFNLNLLSRINRELGGDFDLRAFAHQALYDESERRIEMHLRSRIAQTVTIRDANTSTHFEEGESIWTESSHKFRVEEIPEMARDCGFEQEAQWTDEAWPFAENFWRAV
jgi:dimethylhistidine N-methyltransferase